MGFDSRELTPLAASKTVLVAATVRSFATAAKTLNEVVEIPVSSNTVERLVWDVGRELAARRDQTGRGASPLAQRPESPPDLAVVECDGGRIRMREPGHGPGVHLGDGKGWRETKVACLIRALRQTFAEDPQPEPPECFLDGKHVARIAETEALSVAALIPQDDIEDTGDEDTGDEADATAASDESTDKAVNDAADEFSEDNAGETAGETAEETAEETAGETASAGKTRRDSGARRGRATPETPRKRDDWRPRRQLRTVLASVAPAAAFGRQMAREAKQRRFFEAPAQAFLGDGLAWNWSIHKRQFPKFTPILDFIHALSYVFAMAKTLHADELDAWSQYQAWMRGCWQGEVSQVIAELQAWQQKIGLPEKQAADTDPRKLLARTITYLKHNRERMDYPSYRRQGMPVTTAWMESLVKELNHRVKGTEMFWNQPEGAEAILQARAAALSDDGRLPAHLETRPGSPLTRRPKQPIFTCEK